MQLAIAEAKRARDRGDYAIGAVITQLIGNREVVIASAGNRVKTSGSSIKHVEVVNDGSGNKRRVKAETRWRVCRKWAPSGVTVAARSS